MRSIDLIVVHCAATKPGMDIGVDEIREWHLARQWSDIGYHYVIRRNGTIEQGRDVELMGAHVKGHNANSIGVCLVGGMDDDGDATINYNQVQMDSLQLLLAGLDTLYSGVICGHNDLTDAKTCPNFDVKQWWGLHRSIQSD